MATPGIYLYARTPEAIVQFQVDKRGKDFELKVVKEFENEKCSKMVMSKNGMEIAMIYRSHVIVHCDNSTKFRRFDQGGVVEVLFSPKNTYIVLLSKYVNPETPNLFIYRNLDVPELVHQFVDRPPLEKERRWPSMFWGENENIFSYCVNAQVHFYNRNLKKLDTAVFKKGIVLEYKLAPNGKFVAIVYHNQAMKRKVCEIFETKSFKKPLASAALPDSDRDKIIWNKNSSTILILCTTYMDQRHQSYYGNNELFVLRRGWPQEKKLYNNIMDVKWNQQGSKFCVTFDSPPKADLYNDNGKLIHQFDEGKRDLINFSPDGRILALMGGSKLSGRVEFYNLSNKKMMGWCDTDYPSLAQWQPDSKYFMNATVSPTLQVDNKIQIWDFFGKKVIDMPLKTLYQVEFPHVDSKLFPREKIYIDGKTPVLMEEVKEEQYVPPHLRKAGMQQQVRQKQLKGRAEEMRKRQQQSQQQKRQNRKKKAGNQQQHQQQGKKKKKKKKKGGQEGGGGQGGKKN